MRSKLMLPALLATFAAGCIASPSPEPAALGAPPAAGAVQEALPTLLAWEGHMRAGAAMDLPAHMEETSDAVRPVWSVGFHADVVEAPRAMEVTLSWTAPVARLLLMVVEPGESAPFKVYETEPTDRGPVCLGIPAEALRPGAWEMMAHSQVAVDAALSFEVAMVGGQATIVDEPSDVPAAELPAGAATRELQTPLACTLP